MSSPTHSENSSYLLKPCVLNKAFHPDQRQETYELNSQDHDYTI
jgi:hypothetical protein